MNTELLLGIALLLLGAKVFGYVFEKLKVSSLVGEIFAGILIGPVFGLVTPNGTLGEIAGFGILFFLFLIGLSTRFDDFSRNVYEPSFIALGGALLSFFGGYLVGYIVFSNLNIGIFLGVALLSTSTAMSIRALVDTGKFPTRAGKTLLAIDLADDVIATLALALLSAYISLGNIKIWETVSLFLTIIGFFLVILTVGSNIVSKLLSLIQRIKDEHVIIATSIAFLFLIAFVSEHIGVAAVTGAFLAGIAMNKSQLTKTVIIPKVKTIGYGLFIPLFFAYSAIIFDTKSFFSYFWFIVLLIVVGVIGKLVGCGYTSNYFNFKGVEQKIIGFGMIPRGEYSIITAQIVLTAGIITVPIYTIVISFVILTIVLTPILINLFIK